MIAKIKHKKYEERLELLGLTTLTERRRRSDLIQQYKITNCIQRVDFAVPQIHRQSLSRYNLRGHNQRLTRQIVKMCEERSQFFTNRVENHWNTLPQTVVNSKSTNIFKIGYVFNKN